MINETLLIEVLEASVIKNGEIPLTNEHLCNILKMVKRVDYERAIKADQYDYGADNFF